MPSEMMNDPDFVEDIDEENDRKFREIMMKSISIDNQIICQFAKVRTDSVWMIWNEARSDSRTKSNSFKGYSNAINKDEEGASSFLFESHQRTRSLSTLVPKYSE